MNDDNPNHIHKKSLAVVGQKAILLNEKNELLMLLRSNKSQMGGKWSVAGGALEHGEDPIDGIKREIIEETQLQIDLIKPYHLFSEINKGGDFLVMVLYVTQINNPEVKLNWEHDDFKWLPIKNALELDLTPHARKILEAFQNYEI